MSVVGKGSLINCTKYKWEIKDFFSYTAKDCKCWSYEFHALNSQWFIEIFPNGQTFRDTTEYVALFLHRKSFSTPLAVNLSFGIKSVNHIIVNMLQTTFTYEKAIGHGWPKFIRKSELLERKSELVPSGTLTIICSVERTDNAPVCISGYAKLSQDFINLFKSNEKSDVKLYVKEKTFEAHKIILIARSSVFAAMFKSDTQENKSGVVNIPDCDSEAFGVFLAFLYSGDIDLEECNTSELYRISDKYDVSELKLICKDFMIKNISIDNFCEILILSNLFNENELLSSIQSFFNANYKGIFSSHHWKSLLEENPLLANKLLKAME